MMKTVSYLTAFLVLLFSTQGYASFEVQINSSILGTNGEIVRENLGDDNRMSYGLGAEVYTLYSENVQFGGVLAFKDVDTDGTKPSYTVGALARYNVLPELKSSVFVGGGLVYIDEEGGEGFNVILQGGKRFEISNTITWTPNLTVGLPISGSNREGRSREGYRIAVNLLSFSGFLE